MLGLPRFACLLLAGIALACMCGCGATPAPSSTPVAASSAAYLSGNWLLAGTLPSFPTTGANAGFGLTATFDVAGSQVVGIVTAQVSCSGFTTLGGGGVVAGTVAADGSFTLTSQFVSANGGFVTLAGKAPTAAGGAWTGTYSITPPPTSTCSGTTTGAISATSLPPVTGTYSGSASFSSIIGGPSSAVSLKLVLQQGGTSTNVLGSSAQSNTLLAGTITVQGSGCFTSGSTPATTLPGAVEGNTVLANFTMNDGSTLEMIGTTSTTDSSRLQVQFLTTNMVTCPAAFSGTTTLSK